MNVERSTTSIQIENVEIERARTTRDTRQGKRGRERERARENEVEKKKTPKHVLRDVKLVI